MFLIALRMILSYIHIHTYLGRLSTQAHRVLVKPQSFIEQTKVYLQPQIVLVGIPTTLNLKERHQH